MDIFSQAKRSSIMSLIPGKGNVATELQMISLFRKHGVKGWRRNSNLFGKPDFVFPSLRIAVFVDGEFWHGHRTRSRIPASNSAFWKAKITRNKMRDRLVNKTLQTQGWTVVRIWQHELKTPKSVKKLKKVGLLINP
jgi:DNA mismatch endonuclease (patch repair protein)